MKTLVTLSMLVMGTLSANIQLPAETDFDNLDLIATQNTLIQSNLIKTTITAKCLTSTSNSSFHNFMKSFDTFCDDLSTSNQSLPTNLTVNRVFPITNFDDNPTPIHLAVAYKCANRDKSTSWGSLPYTQCMAGFALAFGGRSNCPGGAITGSPLPQECWTYISIALPVSSDSKAHDGK